MICHYTAPSGAKQPSTTPMQDEAYERWQRRGRVDKENGLFPAYGTYDEMRAERGRLIADAYFVGYSAEGRRVRFKPGTSVYKVNLYLPSSRLNAGGQAGAGAVLPRGGLAGDEHLDLWQALAVTTTLLADIHPLSQGSSPP